MVINPIVGVYIPIIRITSASKEATEEFDTFHDRRILANCSFLFLTSFQGEWKQGGLLCQAGGVHAETLRPQIRAPNIGSLDPVTCKIVFWWEKTQSPLLFFAPLRQSHHFLVKWHDFGQVSGRVWNGNILLKRTWKSQSLNKNLEKYIQWKKKTTFSAFGNRNPSRELLNSYGLFGVIVGRSIQLQDNDFRENCCEHFISYPS